MRKHLFGLACTALLAVACYDDSSLVSRLDQHDSQISALQGDVKKLQEEVTKINSNIEGLQKVVTALGSNVYVKEVTDVKNSAGEVIGYTISFTDNSHITLYHGEKGEQGEQGKQGEQGIQGQPGEQGNPGETPVIGVKESGGVWYWTVNGQFLTDADGHPIRVTGNDGAAGAAGKDGADGLTPQLRINDGNWEVSYDGETWTVVGPATTEATGDAVFSGVKETKSAVVFTLADGTKLSIDKLVDFYITIDDTQTYEVVKGATSAIAYTLTGVGSGESRVDALASGDWWAEVKAADKESGVVNITAGEAAAAKVFLYATNGKGSTDIRSLLFSGGVLTATAPVEEAPAEGGTLEVPVVTNVDYTVAIEEDAQYWLSYVITRAGALRNETITLIAEKNTLPETRSAKVELLDVQGSVIQSFTVKQESGVFETPVFEDSSFKNYILYSSAAADYNENGKVDASEAAKLTELTIDSDYTSLAGIEAFYNLKKITINKTAQLASIDLSGNKQLESVTVTKGYYDSSSLETLDLSDLHALQTVIVSGMPKLKTLTLGNAPKLQTLTAYNTALTSFDIAGAPELLNLVAYGSTLTVESLDLTSNPKIETVNVSSIATLTSADFSASKNLKSLNISGTGLTEADFSALENLDSFEASSTKLVTIDLSNSGKLTAFNVGGWYGYYGKSNTLKTVDIRKAVNLISSKMYLHSTVLEEVIVPKGTSTASWDWTSSTTNPDTGVITPVKVTEVDVEGTEPEEISDYASLIKEPFVKKVVLGKFDADGDGTIDAEEAALVKELDFAECELVDGDLAGLEAFPIEKLILDGNGFTTFDILAFPKLNWLSINDNKLTALSIGTSSSDLKQDLHLEAARNRIATFTGPSYSAKLSYVDLSGNKLASFSAMYATSLKYVDVSDNALTSLSLSGASALEEIDASNNALASAAFNGFSKLVKANVSHNAITSYNFGSSQYALEEADLSYNKITSLDITSIAANPSAYALKTIDVTGNDGFNLVIVGAGNTMPETIEIVGGGDYMVLNAATPTGYVTNSTGNIKSLVADSNAEFANITLNYSLSTSGFKIADGGKAHIVAKSGKRRLVLFAVATEGTPEITIARGSEKSILTKDTDKPGFSGYGATGSNPFTPTANASAATDWKSFIQDGNTDKVFYHLAAFSWSASGGDATEEDEEISFSVTGGTAVIFGINLESYRWDEANM